MTLLHIGLSTSTIEPALTHGRLDGIGVYTKALLQGLPAAGYTVTGFSFSPFGQSKAEQRFSVGHAMPQSYPVLSACDLLTPDSMRARMPVDLYHATDYRIFRMACPVVATLHDAIPLRYPEWCSPRLRSLKNWLQKKAAHKANHVIALSEFAVAELIESFGANERHITVVPCGVDHAWLLPPPQEAVDETLRMHGLDKGYFLFVGTLQPRKNIGRIIDAYLALPAAVRHTRQLVIVGRVGWRCEDVVRKIAAAIQNGERVVWLANLEGEDQLQRIYAGAGIFVFPSLYEGFGIPVAEAFACGVPVVTSNTTSLPEVSQGAALEIDPLCVGEIRAAMLALVQDDALRMRCIAAGRQRASGLSWERTVEQTAAVYRAVLERS
ncbi:MAG TPA: glycosyltransferase family 1 protein [Burkholderiaceae bacterium]|nr:glycosyltransferase family 1 protein [Burkholderiaceae bacterium]